MGAQAQVSTHYVSDDVFTYIHGGPGTEFRIIGSIEAGQPITFNGKTEGEYSQIVDNKNREGWIRSDFVTDKPSLRERFPQMEKELIKVNEQLNNISLNTDNAAQDLQLANKKIVELKALIAQKNTNTLIQIDGGVTLLNAPQILAAGADVLVAGNTVFKSENPTQTIAALKAL